MGDPSTTLTANWQYLAAKEDSVKKKALVYYDTVSRGGNIEAYAHHSAGRVFQIEGLNDRVIARVQLEGLKADTVYYLVVGDTETGFSEELKVKTIPDDESPLRFVTGGDMNVGEDTRTLLENAASYDPDFAVVGGDIAYVNGNLEGVGRWDIWLNYYTESMLTSDGRTIPVVFAIGNHEVRGGFNQSKAEAPFFFGFFGQDEDKSYFARKFGKNFLLLALDSGHVATHESQVSWIRKTLSEHRSTKYRSAVYHVPLFPSHRDFMGHYSDQGRTHWAPVFDAYQLTVAFENHDHTYKRTHLMRENKPTGDGTGTLYLGDGCWGVGARTTDYIQRSYLKQTGGIQHFWVVDVEPDEMSYRAVNLDNKVFDVYPENHPGDEAAAEVFASSDLIYKLPGDVIKVLDIQNAQEPWKQGHSSIIIENTFEEPIWVSLMTVKAENLRILGLPSESLEVKPGLKRVVSIEVQTIKNSGIPLNEFKAAVVANVIMKEPTGKVVARLDKKLTLKLKPKAESDSQ
jgi:hypothetical protein